MSRLSSAKLEKEFRMADFISEFMKMMGPEVSKQLSSNLNIDANTAQQIIPQVAPLILSGLKRQKDEHGGEARVDHILNKYGSPDALEQIGDIFSAFANEQRPADPALGGLLGNSGVEATNLLSNQFKLDGNTAAKIIPMLAPIILGFLTQKRDAGQGSSGIAALLDQNGDGSILDDVAGFLMGGSGKTGGAGNLLGSLLGGLFGKKK